MKIAEAIEITGGLSEPSKMPGYGYNLPAKECQVGSKLRDVANSVCQGCYAMKGKYRVFPQIQEAMYRRLKAIEDPRWAPAMVTLINSKVDLSKGKFRRVDGSFFRWHDSGDIQSTDHLLAIAEIARQTKYVRHWLPTREKGFLWHVMGEIADERVKPFPKNLIIRLSATMIDGPAPGPGIFAHTSTVHSERRKARGWICPANTQGNKCGACRACWDRRVPNVSYPLH